MILLVFFESSAGLRAAAQEGLASGRWAAPAWAIAAFGALIVASAVALLVVRARRKRVSEENPP